MIALLLPGDVALIALDPRAIVGSLLYAIAVGLVFLIVTVGR